MDYGKAILKVREMKSIPRRKLATDVGVSPSYIALIEAGKRLPSLPMLETIAHALGVPLPLLLLAGSEAEDLQGVSPDGVDQLAQVLNSLLDAAPKVPDEEIE